MAIGCGYCGCPVNEQNPKCDREPHPPHKRPFDRMNERDMAISMQPASSPAQTPCYSRFREGLE